MAQMTPFESDHPITCSHPQARARALFQGHIVADSDHTVLLLEAGHPPRIYFPREDVAMDALVKNDHTTRCPHKGVASWFTINRDKKIVEDIAWSYETPFPAMAEIASMLSFDLGKVDIESAIPGAEITREEKAMSDYIRHTDSGSGVSQAAHWPANVGMPYEIEDDEEDEASLF